MLHIFFIYPDLIYCTIRLGQALEPVTLREISEFIALRSKGHLYKVLTTIKDSLDSRLKREGSVVDDHGMKKEQDEKKYLK